MMTTLEIPDPLLSEANELAARDGTTLHALVEEGLRRIVSEKKHTGGFKLRDASFRGNGLRPEPKGASWDEIIGLAYEGSRRVIAIDTNILVYAHREESPHHQAACPASRSFPRVEPAGPVLA